MCREKEHCALNQPGNGLVCVRLCLALSGRSAPGCVVGKGRAAGGPLIFMVMSLAVWAASPAPPGVLPAMPHMQGCMESSRFLGLSPSWTQCLAGNTLILAQHRHSQAAQPQTRPIHMLLDEALWKMVRDLLEAALPTGAGDWRLLAREVPAVGEAVSGERQGAAGWMGAVLCTKSNIWFEHFQCCGWKLNNLLLHLGAWTPGKTLSLPLAGSGSPPGYSLFPPAALCSKAVLSWLCCTLGGSPASWRAAFPCLAAGELNIYVWPQIRVRCKRQQRLWDGGEELCLRRAGLGMG